MWENEVKFFKGSVALSFFLTLVICLTVTLRTGTGMGDQETASKQPVTSSNRPIRDRRDMVLTIGQTQGDLQGKDDKVIQAGIEYLNRVGGGTLHILPGVYNLRNALYLRPNITLKGSGEETVLRKANGVVTALTKDSDWFEYGVRIKDVSGFAIGGGIMLRAKKGEGDWQVCDDVQFRDCKAINNSDLGFHPGSGSQRPVFRNCVAHGNSQGIFFCWSVSDGLVENCILSENERYGVSIGHRDTDNIIRRCRIERNGEVGILFRNEDNEFRCGHRNQIEDCVVRDNGTKQSGIGIDIQGKTQDITIRNTRLENTAGENQKVGIRISQEAERIILQDNTFENCPVDMQDLRPKND